MRDPNTRLPTERRKFWEDEASLLAACTDLANQWARESGEMEAWDEWGLRDLLQRLRVRAMQDRNLLADCERRNADLRRCIEDNARRVFAGKTDEEVGR